MSDIYGQPEALSAVERALVHGTSGILFSGPAGSPKDAIAQRLTTLMEPLTPDELRVLTEYNTVERPTRTIDAATGINEIPQEYAQASYGVLFLSQVEEFTEAAIGILDDCLELARRPHRSRLWVPPLLVASSFMCPCGSMDIPAAVLQCRCTMKDVTGYGARIGRIVIPLGIQVFAPVHIRPTPPFRSPTSAQMRARIAAQRIRSN